jgi:hypothetical protein
VLYLLLIATVGILAAVSFQFFSPGDTAPEQRKDTPAQAPAPGNTPAAPRPFVGNVPSLLVEFRRLKNAGDPRADDLLAPAPPLPGTPVTEEEAERLDGQLFLRQPFKVIQVREEDTGLRGKQRFVLVTEGSVKAPDGVTIRTADGTTRAHNRALLNPDFIVEVQDGKLHGVKVKVHEDPDARSLTPAELKWLLQQQHQMQ